MYLSVICGEESPQISNAALVAVFHLYLTDLILITTIKIKSNTWIFNMTQTSTKVLTAHVPLPLANKLDQMATRLDRSRGWIMKQALSAWIAQEEERDRLTQEALADVDSGRVIDHLAVQAWADSLGNETPLPVPSEWS
jgi:predicted transcriptional regulator